MHAKLKIYQNLNLSFDGEGGGVVDSIQVFKESHLLKNPPLDHTFRPHCKFLILAIFNHAKKFPKTLVSPSWLVVIQTRIRPWLMVYTDQIRPWLVVYTYQNTPLAGGQFKTVLLVV